MADAALLRARLAWVRRLLRAAMVARGAGRTACLLAVLVLADCSLDRVFRLPHAARLLLLVFGLFLLAWRLVREVVRPLVLALSDEALAIEVERRWRGPADLLASGLWFARGRGWGADVLRGDVVARAEGAAAGVMPDEFVQWRPVRRALVLAAVALGIAAGIGLAFPDAAGIWARRNLLLQSIEWPRRTQLAFVNVPSVVARGEPLHIAVRASGVVPSAARLSLRGVESGAARSVAMDRTERDLFEAHLDGLDESTALAVHAGDGLLEDHVIAVEERPRVASARMVVRAPDYIAPEPLELPWDAPAFSLPAGSEATMVLEATKPLSDARCSVGDAPGPQPEWDGDRSVRFTLPVQADVECGVVLTDKFRLESARPFRAAITAVPDREPQVRIAADGVGDLVLPTARLPLVVQAEDDYGSVAVWLEIDHEGTAGTAHKPPVQVYDGAARRAVRERVALDLADYDLPAEGRLVVRALARDGCTVGVPNVGTAPAAVFRLAQARELLAALLLRQQDLRRDLEDHLAEQARLKDALVEMPPGESIASLVRRQQALAGLFGLVAAGYADVLAQMLNNGLLTDAAHATRTATIVSPLEDLAAPGGAVGQAASAIAQADASATAHAMDVVFAQAARVRERMLLMEGYSAVLTSVQELAETQSDLLHRTRAAQEHALDNLWSE